MLHKVQLVTFERKLWKRTKTDIDKITINVPVLFKVPVLSG